MLTILITLLASLNFGTFQPGELVVFEDATAIVSESDTCAYAIHAQDAEHYMSWTTACIDGGTITVTSYTYTIGEDFPLAPDSVRTWGIAEDGSIVTDPATYWGAEIPVTAEDGSVIASPSRYYSIR